MIFIDTTFLVDVLRKNPDAVLWLDENEELALYTSEINAFELYSGLYRISKKSKSKLQKRKLELEQVLARVEVLPFERASAIEAGKILANLMQKGKLIGTRDVMIAGSALAHGIQKIVTRNVKHFKSISGLTVILY
ncbi:MAG: type II toxin-antitoxin system VapC family toxin [Candidatus Thorarchaeota archaeon]